MRNFGLENRNNLNVGRSVIAACCYRSMNISTLKRIRRDGNACDLRDKSLTKLLYSSASPSFISVPLLLLRAGERRARGGVHHHHPAFFLKRLQPPLLGGLQVGEELGAELREERREVDLAPQRGGGRRGVVFLFRRRGEMSEERGIRGLS